MKCKYCGNQIAKGSKKCDRCGNKVGRTNNRLFLIILFLLLLAGGCVGVYYGLKNAKRHTPTKVIITVKPNDDAMGTVKGSGEYERNETVTIEAIANEGCQFVEWNDGNTDSIREFLADQDKVYVARFDSIASETSLVHGDDVTIPQDEPKVEPKDEPKVEPKVEPKDEPKDEPKVEPKVEPKLKEKNYWFGRYEGNLKNGIPEGRGVMYYNCHVQIAKYQSSSPGLFAEDGDYFDGNWKNGDIYTGSLYNKEGVLKYENIRVKPRTRPYDLEKDEYIK